MPRAERLEGAARDEALARLAALGWETVAGRDAVARRFRFGSFPAAMAWMARVAFDAERLDHHPEWTNVWRRVDVTLTTHSCDGLSALDVALAEAMEAALAPPSPPSRAKAGA